MSFDHRKIEQKWQQFWERENFYAAEDPSTSLKASGEKFYVLVEFPYPSGDGLHVGHCRSYTALDIVARKKRMEDRNVLFPIGFDAFGLPTENYAIKNKIQPRVATDKNIKKFTQQLKSIGFSFDWRRAVDTTDPRYFKWTQWIFLQFFQKGLAYQAEIPINWCLSCKIGLANEEVVNGKCERCGGEIERRVKKQWMLAITKYAQRLLDDLETVDYLPRIKTQQQNWIGRSEGCEVDFRIGGVTRGDLNGDFHPTGENDCEGLFLLTWNTAAADGCTENDAAAKGFTAGEKLLNSKEKAGVILAGLAEAEDSARDDFRILEAVVAENHVHAVVWVSEESGGIGRVVNKMKGVSSRRFFENYPQLANAKNSNTLDSIIDIKNSAAFNPTVKNSAAFNPTVKNSAAFNPTVNGGVRSVRDKNDKSQFNHLWRKGYHFSLLAKHASYENAMDYISQHSQKSKVASFYAALPLTFRVFTTRPDTLFGCTFMVLAPEHELLAKLKSKIKNWVAVEKYLKAAAAKSDLERTELAKEKTGVKLEGVAAVNPVNGEEIPIFVADYVLISYGSGAIMAVPAHDERDFEFANAKKFGIEIRYVIHPSGQWSWKKGKYPNSKKFMQGWETPHDLQLFEGFKITQKDKVENDILTKHLEDLGKCFPIMGNLINSSEFTGLHSTEAIPKIIKFLEEKKVGKEAINFKLRDWVFSRQRYWGEPIPIVHCKDCGVVPLDEKDLPLELPEVENYEPTDTGESPLAAIEKWVNCDCPKCGGAAQRETDTMPNWAGSSWYFLRYTDPQNAKAFADPKKLKYWTPVDLYNGGMEHTVLHLLYSRFWHKFLFDLKLVPTSEPYSKRISHGMILGPDGEKMSKSRGNVVNPDEIIAKFGADTLRLYEMFIGPFDQAAAWNEGGVEGVRRFLEKVERLSEKVGDSLTPQLTGGLTLEKLLHKTIKKVSADLDDFHFNTAVSACMIFVNEAQKEPKISKESFGQFLTLLAPFAPHLCEELWERLGKKKSIQLEPWPTFDAKLARDEKIELVIQVNGKLRDTIEVEAGIEEKEAIDLAKKSEKVAKWLEGKEIRKEIFVKGKLVNLVVGE